MIIDVHGHVIAPPELYEYTVRALASRGALGSSRLRVSDDRVAEVLATHIAMLDGAGTDVQLVSPRPFATMHAERPAGIVHLVTQAANDLIAQQLRLEPDRLRGIAGLPQAAGTPADEWVEELSRCVTELGFVGCLINPDPAEGLGGTPPMGDESWYPLYEAMVDLDVPGIIHPGGCRNGRESFSNHFITEESIAVLSIIDGRVFDTFPTLKLIVCHGGGSIPYQVGRWRALRWRHWRPALDMRELGRDDVETVREKLRGVEPFDDSLRRLYFDTVLYSKESIELLIRVVGADRAVFGAELPGTGSSVDPETGRWLDDLRPVIEEIDWLTDEDRTAIFEGNAKRLFSRAF